MGMAPVLSSYNRLTLSMQFQNRRSRCKKGSKCLNAMSTEAVYLEELDHAVVNAILSSNDESDTDDDSLNLVCSSNIAVRLKAYICKRMRKFTRQSSLFPILLPHTHILQPTLLYAMWIRFQSSDLYSSVGSVFQDRPNHGARSSTWTSLLHVSQG